MTKEQVIDHFKQCKADLENQNKIFSNTLDGELNQMIYDNQIRISELNRVIDYLEGDW